MLQILRFKKVIQETKTVISFETYVGNRVDISKKFIKKTDSGNTMYFLKKVPNFNYHAVTYIRLDKLYIVEVDERSLGISAGNISIFTIKDIIPFDEVKAYEALNSIIKETRHGAL